ncbi:MAG TPA: hypothetical protein VJA21_12075 [Verrucomicrobiae bacterium]
MGTSIVEAEASPTAETAPPIQMPLTTLARFLARIYDQHLVPQEPKRALFEPRRVLTPDGYHSTKCVAAGLYALLTQARLAAEVGEVLPTEVTGSTFCYRVLDHDVPVYFVDDEFARAVAATELPGDFTFGDLNWPQSGMVVGWPPRFIQEYTGRDFCYVYAANCPAGSYYPKGLERAPVIEVPEGRSKIGWFYYATTASGRPECFVSAYLIKDKLAQAITDYTYTDFTGEPATKVQADKELTERVSVLMLKLLVILNMRPSFIASGTQQPPRRAKHARERKRELWSANFIGRGYRLARERHGTHISPRIHVRRGHVTWQVTGPRTADSFIPASALPRNDRGVVDWDKVAPETRQKFLRCHKRLWLEPVLIGGER